MTHLFDTSAVLAGLLDENGAARVDELLADPDVVVGVSALTLFEVGTAAFRQTGSWELAEKAVEKTVSTVAVVVPLTSEIVRLALELRAGASSRIATVDCAIAATAVWHGATLVHRDPHFDALSASRLAQEALPDKT